MSYVFGPVPSRRLGRSLGVDLVPFKTCPYDCIYCQIGCTTHKIIEPKEWVPMEEVLEELKTKLSGNPDYITLSGSGEPTLYSRTGDIIDAIKKMTDIPVAVLTNGSLLWKEEVRKQLINADLVVPSLDAGDKESFEAVNRPHKDISFDKMVDGLIQFRKEFKGQYWLEILILENHLETINEIVKYVKLIKPDKVQLNTVTRPPAEKFAVGVSKEKLVEISIMFDPHAEVIADFKEIHEKPEFKANCEDVLNMLKRRPCSVEDISSGLRIHRNEVIKYIEELMAKKLIKETLVNNIKYYESLR